MNNDFFPFDGQQRMGASAVFAFALLSIMTLSLTLLRMIWVYVAATVRQIAVENLTCDGFFFKSQLGSFTGCLFFANMLTAIGGIIEINWVALDGVKHGSTCNAQGVLSQIGELATAYFIVVLGIHAFITLALRTHHPSWFVTSSIVFGWTTSIAVATGPVSISSQTLGPLYGFVTLGCNVTRAYPVAHVLIYFVPLFLSFFASTVIYALIFLILRGNITVNGSFKFHMYAQGPNWRSADTSIAQYKRFVRSIALSIMWFPAAFMICVTPNAIVQLVDTSGYTTSSTTSAFTLVLRHMNGLVDVVILLNILRVLGPVFQTPVTMTDKTSSGTETPSGPTLGLVFRQSFNGDGHVSQAYTFAPVLPARGDERRAAHKGSGSDTSATHLISPNERSGVSSSSDLNRQSSSDPNHAFQTNNDWGHTRLVCNASNHIRGVTKSMISKPIPADVDMYGMPIQAVVQVPSIKERGPFVEASQHFTRPVHAAAAFIDSSRSSGCPAASLMLQHASHKPLPLLPEAEEEAAGPLANPDPWFLSSYSNYRSSTATRIIPGISSRFSATDTRVSPTVHGSPIPYEAIGYDVHSQNRQYQRVTAVISLYTSSRRSAHEDMLPDFPITASEYLTEPRTPHLEGEPRDFVQQAPPRAIQRSPSIRSSPMRPIIFTSQRFSPSIAQEVSPVTAAVTEFDVNEYLSSPLMPVSVVPSVLDLFEQKLERSSSRAGPVVYATLDRTDEAPGLPPLPSFRPRLTVYDDDDGLSQFSASTSGQRFGARPRDSRPDTYAFPLPPHMRLDVDVSPVVLSIPTPALPARGFRPIP